MKIRTDRPASTPCLDAIAARRGVNTAGCTEQGILGLYERNQILFDTSAQFSREELGYAKRLARKYGARQLIGRLEYVR